MTHNVTLKVLLTAAIIAGTTVNYANAQDKTFGGGGDYTDGDTAMADVGTSWDTLEFNAGTLTFNNSNLTSNGSGAGVFYAADLSGVGALTLKGAVSGTQSVLEYTGTGGTKGCIFDLANFDADMTLQDLAFKGANVYRNSNETVAYGGSSLAGFENATAALTNTLFDSNKVELVQGSQIIPIGIGGGGLYISGEPHDTTTVTPGNNKAVLTKTDFTNNSATISGTAAATTSSVLGGGLYIANMDTITYTDGEISDNIAESQVDGVFVRGGGMVITSGTAGTSGLTAAKIENVTFDRNKAIATDNEAGGGGLALGIDGGTPSPRVDAALDDVTFTGNEVTAASGTAWGGAILNFGTGALAVTARTADVEFDSNKATSTSGTAYGGAIANVDGTALTITATGGKDVLFTGNIAEGNTASYGGAIANINSSASLTVNATNGDILFDGNQAGNGSNTGSSLGNSIYSRSDVAFNTASNRTITDNDGHYVLGAVTKTGAGTFDLGSKTVQSRAGNYDIQSGTFKTRVFDDGGLKSNFYAVRDINGIGTSNGKVTVGSGVTWIVNIDDVPGRDGTHVSVGDGGFTNVANAQAALDRGSALIHFTADDDGFKWDRVRSSANLSDIFISAAYLHKWNTIYNGTNGHIDSYFTYNPMFEFGGGTTILGQPRANTVVPLEFVGLGMKSVWVNYVGRSGGLESSFANYNDATIKTNSDGVQVGCDFATGRGYVFGAIFGYEDSRGRVRLDEAHANDYYFGLYGAKQFLGGFDIRGMAGYGHQKYRFERFDGVDFYRFGSKGNTLEANLEVGRRFYSGLNFSLRPFVGFDFINNEIGAANEGLGGFQYGKSRLQQGYVRLGSDVQWMYGCFNLNGMAAFSQQVLDSRASASVGQSGVLSMLRSNKYGDSVFTFGLGAGYAMNPRQTWSLFLNYNADVFADGRGKATHTASFGTQFKF